MFIDAHAVVSGWKVQSLNRYREVYVKLGHRFSFEVLCFEMNAGLLVDEVQPSEREPRCEMQVTRYEFQF